MCRQFLDPFSWEEGAHYIQVNIVSTFKHLYLFAPLLKLRQFQANNNDSSPSVRMMVANMDASIKAIKFYDIFLVNS